MDKFCVLLVSLCLCFVTAGAFADGAPRHDAAALTVVKDSPEMVAQILQATGGQMFSVNQFLGFAKESFKDLESFKKEFAARALQLNQQTQDQFGAKAVTIYILDGSVHGIGLGYEILKDLIDSGEIKEALVVGHASAQTFEDHIENSKSGGEPVISASQKLLLVHDESEQADLTQNEKTKVLMNLSRFAQAGFTSLNVFGGAQSSFQEALQIILEYRPRPQKIEVELFAGHDPLDPNLDTGMRAADMLAWVLLYNRYLLTDNISVKVHSRVQDSVRPVDRFNQTIEYNRLVYAESNAKEVIKEIGLRNDLTEAETATLKMSQTLLGLKDLPLLELRKYQLRAARDLDQARQLLTLGYRGAAHQAMQGHVDQCVVCEQDSKKILASYQRRGASCAADLGPR